MYSLVSANEWVTLTEYSSLSDVDALRLHLESKGITVCVLGDATTTTFGLLNATGGIRLQVPMAEFREAYALMKEWEASLLLVAADCPVCRSYHVGYAPERRNPLLFVLAIIVFGIFLIVFQSKWVRLECRDCKHTWKVRKDSLDESPKTQE